MEPNESIWPESYKNVESKILIVMSGMSIKPGGGGVAPRPISNDSDYCLNLKIKTNLSSVKMDVLAKSKGSSNPHNLVKATVAALTEMRDAYTVAGLRGVPMTKVFNG